MADLAPGLAKFLLLLHIVVDCKCYYLRATTTVCVVCFFFSSSLVCPFSHSGRSVSRQQLLATSLCVDNRAPLGAGHSCAPGLLLAMSGSGGLNRNSAETLPALANCNGHPGEVADSGE